MEITEFKDITEQHRDMALHIAAQLGKGRAPGMSVGLMPCKAWGKDAILMCTSFRDEVGFYVNPLAIIVEPDMLDDITLPGTYSVIDDGGGDVPTN
jgi:hypothetical protein